MFDQDVDERTDAWRDKSSCRINDVDIGCASSPQWQDTNQFAVFNTLSGKERRDQRDSGSSCSNISRELQ